MKNGGGTFLVVDSRFLRCQYILLSSSRFDIDGFGSIRMFPEESGNKKEIENDTLALASLCRLLLVGDSVKLFGRFQMRKLCEKLSKHIKDEWSFSRDASGYLR